ncbi:MAG: hypothetical protein MH208_15395 [Marinobacter sp.]|nr:hypothetical protein [Marinobacter sp.]
MITADSDDVTYVALDEATKSRTVLMWCMPGRFYAGAAHSSGLLSG